MEYSKGQFEQFSYHNAIFFWQNCLVDLIAIV